MHPHAFQNEQTRNPISLRENEEERTIQFRSGNSFMYYKIRTRTFRTRSMFPYGKNKSLTSLSDTSDVKFRTYKTLTFDIVSLSGSSSGSAQSTAISRLKI